MPRAVDLARAVVPDAVFHRAVAWSYRMFAESRLLLLDDLVPRSGMTVDVGAWWGPWTYWLARRNASVWAFEPNPEMARFLARVAAATVRVENVALSDRHGSAQLHVPDGVGRDALATLSAAHRPAGARPVPVRLTPLDDYAMDDVSFVKIDVEGHEHAVLRGAERTLVACRPTLLVEIDQARHDEPIQVVFDWLAELGYAGWFRRDRAWAPLDQFDVTTDQRPGAVVTSRHYVDDFAFRHRSMGGL